MPKKAASKAQGKAGMMHKMQNGMMMKDSEMKGMGPKNMKAATKKKGRKK